MTEFTRFLIAALATWRLTHLLHSEDGPGRVLLKFRMWVGNGFVGQLLDCFNCSSLWVAAPVALALGNTWTGWLLYWLGLSGAACLLETATARAAELETEVQEENNGMLRPTPEEHRRHARAGR